VRVAVIVTAAGSGTRLGREMPKALVPLDGVPVVTHALRGVLAAGVVDEVVVTIPAHSEQDFADAVALVGTDAPVPPLRCVTGGATRQASVAAGLAALGADVDVVLVHDAARALTPPEVVARVVEAVRAGAPCVIPVVPVTDSVVDVSAGVRPVDRGALRVVQTPQGFDRAVLDRAHRHAEERAADEATAATDDASLCAALGLPVAVVEGHPDGAKITTSRDLAVARMVVRDRRSQHPARPPEPPAPPVTLPEASVGPGGPR
jgi:2-C-methyl-D-erythritol 4-phosphate cytidylyltransferase